MAMGILLIAIDQCIKVAVKLHMGLGEQIVVFDWFRIDFIENRGMAFGMEIGSKLLLSLFRIVAVGFIIWYIGKKIRQGRPLGFILILTMICAGAAGNIFDSLFYGQIFTESVPYGEPAQLVAWGEGYAPMLMDAWWTCSTSRSSMAPSPHGCRSGVENRLSSSRPCSTSPTLVSASVWRCF